MAAPLALVGVPFVLVVKQPDLGTALVLCPSWSRCSLASGSRLRLLGALALAGLAVAAAGVVRRSRTYQRDRLLVFLDPFRDPLGTAYNVIQAKIAIGSGQLLGKGVSGATQSRLAFLPERHTDFIFAVFAEMWGFVGCLVLIVAYALLVSGASTSPPARADPRGACVALGVTAVFATQILINLGMVTGLLPVVGDPAAAHELRRIVHGRLADGAGTPALGPNAAVPVNAGLADRLLAGYGSRTHVGKRIVVNAGVTETRVAVQDR